MFLLAGFRKSASMFVIIIDKAN